MKNKPQKVNVSRNKKNTFLPQKITPTINVKKPNTSASVQNDLVTKYNSLPEDQQIKIAQHHDQSVSDMKTVIQNKVQEINEKAIKSTQQSSEVKLPDTGVTKTFSKDNSVFNSQNELQKLHQKIFEEPLKAIRPK